MDKQIVYRNWFWTNKLAGVLRALSHYSNHVLDEEEIEMIRHGLVGTNDENDRWLDHTLNGAQYSIDVRLAFDAEEGSEMTHIQVKASEDVQKQLESLNLFGELGR